MAKKSLGIALITGASSGIGAIYADRLARRGFDLILVARNQERLETLASRLRKETSKSVEIVKADLGKKEDLARVVEILKTRQGITMLVNNAGFGATAPLLQSDVDRMEDMVTLNVTALMRLTYAVVPNLVARGGGTVINVASIVAITPETLDGVYGGTKSFVLAFSQSLNQEVAKTGVRIQAVLPGATSTEFWDAAGASVHDLPLEVVMSAPDMVDAALAGLDLGELVTIPSLPESADWQAYESARQALAPKFSPMRPPDTARPREWSSRVAEQEKMRRLAGREPITFRAFVEAHRADLTPGA
jgi:short-subunit dehydrogenase